MTPGPNWRRLWDYAVADGIPARSLRIALVVGTGLNLINQGDAIIGPAPVNWTKLILTFAMPYVVSTYGAVAVQMSNRTEDRRDGDRRRA